MQPAKSIDSQSDIYVVAPPTPLVLRPGEVRNQDVTSRAITNALVTGTLLGACGYLIQTMSKSQGNAWAAWFAGAGGILGAIAGSTRAQDHNAWAQTLREYQSLDAHGQLSPQTLPRVSDALHHKRDVGYEAITAAGRNAALWIGVNLGLEALSRGKEFSWQKLDYAYVLGDGLAWGAVYGIDRYMNASAHNHRADVVHHFEQKAAQAGYTERMPTRISPAPMRSFAAREETRSEGSAEIGRV